MATKCSKIRGRTFCARVCLLRDFGFILRSSWESVGHFWWLFGCLNQDQMLTSNLELPERRGVTGSGSAA